MSRYRIPGYEDAHHVVVGWDSPLETFFLHVDDYALVEEVEDTCICWRGTSPREIPTLEALAAVVAPYATLTPEITVQLQQDYDQRTPPTPLQRHMVRLLQHLKTMP